MTRDQELLLAYLRTTCGDPGKFAALRDHYNATPVTTGEPRRLAAGWLPVDKELCTAVVDDDRWAHPDDFPAEYINHEDGEAACETHAASMGAFEPAKVEATTKNDRIYPCADCGVMRSKAEGGTTFTCCDECWDKSHPKAPTGPVTAATIKALPPHLRDYIHELETRCDPAGTVLELVQLRDQVAALSRLIEEMRAKEVPPPGHANCGVDCPRCVSQFAAMGEAVERSPIGKPTSAPPGFRIIGRSGPDVPSPRGLWVALGRGTPERLRISEQLSKGAAWHEGCYLILEPIAADESPAEPQTSAPPPAEAAPDPLMCKCDHHAGSHDKTVGHCRCCRRSGRVCPKFERVPIPSPESTGGGR